MMDKGRILTGFSATRTSGSSSEAVKAGAVGSVGPGKPTAAAVGVGFGTSGKISSSAGMGGGWAGS